MKSITLENKSYIYISEKDSTLQFTVYLDDRLILIEFSLNGLIDFNVFYSKTRASLASLASGVNGP